MKKQKWKKLIIILVIILGLLYIFPPFMISGSGITVAKQVENFEQPADIAHAAHSWTNIFDSFLLINFHIPDHVEFSGDVEYHKICPFVWKVKETDPMYSVYKMKARKRNYYMIHLAP